MQSRTTAAGTGAQATVWVTSATCHPVSWQRDMEKVRVGKKTRGWITPVTVLFGPTQSVWNRETNWCLLLSISGLNLIMLNTWVCKSDKTSVVAALSALHGSPTETSWDYWLWSFWEVGGLPEPHAGRSTESLRTTNQHIIGKGGHGHGLIEGKDFRI